MTTTTSSNYFDDAMEHQELQLWSNDEVKDETRLTLRHTRNPKSSPTRVFVGTVLLTLMIYAVVKMLSLGVKNIYESEK
jgi:hypothetical protein